MGVATWIGAGMLAAIASRWISLGRPPRRLGELAVAVLAALVFGVAATVLDFGGWIEPDWRAAAFCFPGAFAATGALRLFTAVRGGAVRSPRRPSARGARSRPLARR